MIKFWKSWTKESEYIYFITLGLLALAILFYGYFYFVGLDSLIEWDILTNIEKLRIPIDNFEIGVLNFSIEADAFLVFQQYMGSDIHINLYAAYFCFGLTIIALLLALTVFSFLNNWLYYVGTTIVLSYLILQQPDILFDSYWWNKYIQIAPVLFIGGVSYYFYAINSRAKFVIRFFTFLFFTCVYYLLLTNFTAVEQPLVYLIGFGAVAIIIISLGFIFFVSFETVYAFLYLNNVQKNDNSSNGLLHFCLIFGLYFLNLVLQYLQNARIFSLDLVYLSPFFLLIISVIFGIWGFKERSILFFKTLPFYPFGAVIYTTWAIICFSTIGYYFATGSDSMVEVFEDFILFTHIGFGFAFFLYVLGNYARIQQGNSNTIHKNVYANDGISFVFVYGTGLLFVFTMFSYSNLFTWYQAQAGYYNGVADAYFIDKKLDLAQEYYQKAASLEFQNHKSNYSLATIFKNKGKYLESAGFYKKANLKQPSPYAYANLGRTYFETGKKIEAIFILKEGLKKFPTAIELNNNLGLIYNEIGFADSAVYYFNLSVGTNGNIVADANQLAVQIKSNSNPKVVSESENIPYKINRLIYKKILNISDPEKLILTDTVLNELNFALVNNYTLFALANRDTTSLPILKKYTVTDTNNYYKSETDYQKALINYYNGEISLAVKSVDEMQLTDGLNSGFYLNTVGLWTLKNQASRFSADIFELAYQKMSKTSLINKAVALMEAGMYKEAISIFNSDAITNDPQSNAIAQKLSKVFMFANFNQILIASDPDKYLALHYRMQDFNDQQLGNLFFSIKDTVYQTKAGIDLFEYYLKKNNTIRCGEILAELMEKYPKYMAQINLIRLKYYAASKQWDELKQLLKSAKLNKDGKNYLPYFEAKILENAKKNAAEKYLNAYKNTPFDEKVLLDASSYFQEKQKDASQSFNILLDGVSLNPYSVDLYKAYCLQAINYGIPAFAENGLRKIKQMVSAIEYEKFVMVVEKQKVKFLEGLGE